MKEEKNKLRLAKRVQDLEVYKLAFETAMKIFEITKSFPRDGRPTSYVIKTEVRWLKT